MEEVDGLGIYSVGLIYNMLSDTQLRNAIMDNKCVFFVLPTAILKEKIIKASDEKINQLPNELKTLFLEDKGFYVENDMISKFVDGTLDEKNKYLLSMCDVRVMQDRIKIT